MTIWDIDLGWFVLLALAAAFGLIYGMERYDHYAKKVEHVMKALDEEEK